MQYLLWIFISITLFSCATKEQQKKYLVWEQWQGHSIKEVKKHPYFKNLPVTKFKHAEGVVTWMYLDQTHFPSDAYCQSLGGCMGMQVYNCENAFSVKDKIIIGFEQDGTCPPLKTIEVQKI